MGAQPQRFAWALGEGVLQQRGDFLAGRVGKQDGEQCPQRHGGCLSCGMFQCRQIGRAGGRAPDRVPWPPLSVDRVSRYLPRRASSSACRVSRAWASPSVRPVAWPSWSPVPRDLRRSPLAAHARLPGRSRHPHRCRKRRPRGERSDGSCGHPGRKSLPLRGNDAPHTRHGRPCARHPRLWGGDNRKAWMAGTRPAMTGRRGGRTCMFIAGRREAAGEGVAAVHNGSVPPQHPHPWCCRTLTSPAARERCFATRPHAAVPSAIHALISASASSGCCSTMPCSAAIGPGSIATSLPSNNRSGVPAIVRGWRTRRRDCGGGRPLQRKAQATPAQQHYHGNHDQQRHHPANREPGA